MLRIVLPILMLAVAGSPCLAAPLYDAAAAGDVEGAESAA